MLVPLRDEHARSGPAALVEGEPRELESIASQFGDRPICLVAVEDPDTPSTREHFESPFLRRAVLGWLRLAPSELASYAWRTAELLRRRAEPDAERLARPVVLLGPREKRYLDILDELERIIAGLTDLRGFRWSAERIRGTPLLRALHLGAAAVMYTGHGSARGWHAYTGITAETLIESGEWSDQDVNAIVLSLACHTGQPRPQRAFADALIAHGVAGAVLAPIGEPLHTSNRILANTLITGLGSGPLSLAELVTIVRSKGASLQGYSVIGDPSVSAVGTTAALERAERVFAPAANADLTSWAQVAAN